MDLSFRAIHDVVHPTAAFTEPDEADCEQHFTSEDGSDVESPEGWDHSPLNPKNRIDSLEPLPNALWRIDGSSGLGTQYYAIPLFLKREICPMRIDVFVKEGALYPHMLQELLDLGEAFHTKDAKRVRRLGICRHLVRILQWHTTRLDGDLHPKVVKELYRRGPFGTMLIIENLTCHIRDSRIVISPNFPLEASLLSPQELSLMWGLKKHEMPPEVDIADVKLETQLHDSVCLVRVKDDHNEDDKEEKESDLLVLKALTSNVKYMYHEIRTLLKDVPPHPYIVSRPLHIVSKACLFGGKRGVIGFTMQYHTTGSLRDILPFLRIHNRLALSDQLRWSVQTAKALCHIWKRGHVFYPDLRLDNMVLNAPAPDGDIVVIDFEQRGVWSGFCAPEVDHVENLRILAFDDPDSEMAIPEDISDEYKDELAEVWAAAEKGRPTSWRRIGQLEQETKYSNPAQGYNVTWICLTRQEQEAAMVYMLGRVLWCIFEGMSAPDRGAVWQSYRREPVELEFPQYHRTPKTVQEIISRCFGEHGGEKRTKFVRVASKLYMEEGMDRLVSDDLGTRAQNYWQDQLAAGKVWLDQRNRRLQLEHNSSDDTRSDKGDSNTSAHGRPSLEQVCRWLEELRL